MNYRIVIGGAWWTMAPEMVKCIFGMSDFARPDDTGFSINSFRAVL